MKFSKNTQNFKDQMAKISITRALSELKTEKKRLEKKIREFRPIAVQRGASLVGCYRGSKVDDFVDSAKESNQSINDLLTRIEKVKAAIEESNSTTKVMIAGKEYTVREAINMKSLIGYKKTLLQVMKEEFIKASEDFEDAEETNKKRVEKLVQDASASGSGKLDPAIEENALKSVESLYSIKVVDPIGLDKLIPALEKEIEDFETNVDFVLSESNSKTAIEVD